MSGTTGVLIPSQIIHSSSSLDHLQTLSSTLGLWIPNRGAILQAVLVLMLRLTKSSDWFALAVILLMCLFQSKSDVIVNPKYFVDFTMLRVCPCSV